MHVIEAFHKDLAGIHGKPAQFESSAASGNSFCAALAWPLQPPYAPRLLAAVQAAPLW